MLRCASRYRVTQAANRIARLPALFLLLLPILAIAATAAQEPFTDQRAPDEQGMLANFGTSEPELNAIEVQVKQGYLGRAESGARAYVERQPGSFAGHYLLGYILYRENKPAESLAEYTLGAHFHGPTANDLGVVAMDYVLLADYADADKWLTQATEWEPENALYWYHLGRTKYNENRFKEAIEAFNQVLKLDPHDIRAEYNLGLSLAGLGRDDEAIADYKLAIEWEKADGKPDAQPFLDLGLLLLQEGQPGQARDFLRKAVQLDARNPKAHESLGRDYEQLKNFDMAESEYKSAIALSPNISALHFELGRIYQKTHQAELAKTEFTRCAVLNSSHSTDSSETPNGSSADHSQ